jgi:basic amino acid/polyamine antiporter, APA family
MTVNQSTCPGLRRHSGLIGLTAYGVGTILGAGIYALIGEAASLAGDGLWLSFLLGARIAALTGLSDAELTTTFPRAGAEFEFVWQAIGKTWLAFLVGWILRLSIAASASTVALGFAEYFHALTGSPVVVTAVALLVLLSAVSFVGVRESTSANIVFTFIEACGLVLLIAAALGASGRLRPTLVLTNWPGIYEATALILFAYLGFEDIANAADETVAPERTIPVAILLSIVLTAILYVGVALASLALVPPARLAASSAPLADALAAV